MSIPVSVTNLPASRYVVPTSRYINSEVLLYSENSILTFGTYTRSSYPSNTADKFDIVPAGEEFRPDKTSMRAYNTPDFWWRIMEANQIYDIFDYKAGTQIRVPAVVNVF